MCLTPAKGQKLECFKFNSKSYFYKYNEGATTLCIVTFSITRLSITTFSITRLSISTFSIRTFIIMIKNVTLSIMAERYNAECDV